MHRNKVIPSYFGSKNTNGLYQFIINLFCPHTTYIEGFLGSGIILQLKTPSKKTYAFELDRSVIDNWNYHGRNFNVEIISRSFITNWEKLSLYCKLNETLVYLDPPYKKETRTSKTRYRHEITDLQHEELLSLVLKVKSNYVISCYDNELYNSTLKGWNKAHCNSITRAGVRVETIYYNFEPIPGHTDNRIYAGVNFTDRQRIKRKVTRTLLKIEKLPELERKIILEDIRNIYFHDLLIK